MYMVPMTRIMLLYTHEDGFTRPHTLLKLNQLVLSCPLFGGFTGLERNIGCQIFGGGGGGGWSPPPAPTPLRRVPLYYNYTIN